MKVQRVAVLLTILALLATSAGASSWKRITSDYLVEVARGNIPGQTMWHAICEREDMGTTVAGEDCWRGNELSPAPTSHVLIPTPAPAGEQMTVVSESVNDAAAGTGVQTVRINYIDAAGDQQTEDVTLNGTTGVNTVATDIRFVNDFFALTVGSGGVAADHIKIYKTGTVGLVYNMIHQGGNKSLVSHRMVPAGHTLVLLWWHAAEAQGKRVAVRIRSTDLDGVRHAGVFLFKDTVYINKAAPGQMDLYTLLPALSIVKVSGWPDAADAEISASWTGILIED
ncbi:MAG: hypothetical protein GY719_25960 [bacterium]|nr:hypothetical protein [bacterium]